MSSSHFAFVQYKCPLMWTAFIRWTANNYPGASMDFTSRINLLIKQSKAKSIVIFTENYWREFACISEMWDSNEATDYIAILFFVVLNFSIETH